MNPLLPALVAATAATPSLPFGFVDVSHVVHGAILDVRYAGAYNFIGRPVAGYEAPRCYLTLPAALALAGVERELKAAGLRLRIYDCYRPQRAVNEFIAWSRDPHDQRMKPAFYPNVDKAKLFELGYLAAKSSHSRGSTVDLTIERERAESHEYVAGEPLEDCTAPFFERFRDGSLDMGTDYDCMDPLSHPKAEVGPIASAHRRLLRDVMENHGFKGIKEEWWHFTLKDEPFPSTYFDFPIR